MADNTEKEELIRRAIVTGDAGAFDLLWEAYSGLLFGLILSLLCSHHDAEEVLQDVFLKLARNKDAVAGAKNMAGYIYTMARNEALSFRRRNRRVPEPVDPADFWLVPANVGEKPDHETARIAEALGKLPEEQRVVIVMKTYKEMTFQTISGVLDISLNTAASRYRYGMEKLKVLLETDHGD